MIQFLDDLRNVKPERHIRCPRCGYDQRGIIETWKDLCPLEGVCAECGLHWLWCELLNPRITPPKWCVEFATNPRQLPRRSLRTAVMVFRPRRFWKSLEMYDEPRWRRIIEHLALWLIVCYVLFALAHGVVAWRTWHQYVAWGSVSTTTGWDCAIRAAVLPLSSASPGTFTGGIARRGPVAHESPRELFETFWIPWLLPMLGIIVIIALCAVGFAVLPQSRRIAKVRWAHIVRIATHGSVMVLPALLMYICAMMVGDRFFLSLLNIAGVLLLLVIPMQFVWWSTATGHYLKMRHPWGVGAAVVIMSVLVTFTAILYVALMMNDSI